MKKEEYLERLEYYLDERDFSQEEIDEILEDYELMIDEALDNDPNITDFDELLGNPKDIVKQINKKLVIRRVKGNRLVALSPFIATIAFFVLGFGFELWNPGWMVYLIIPITGIISGRRHSPIKSLLEVLPFVSLTAFLIIGLSTDVWHPTWMVFLILPLFGILERKAKFYGLWFVIALTIPIVYLLSIYYFPFDYNWVILLLLILPGLNGGSISFRVNGLRQKNLEWNMAITIALATLSFILIGILTSYWHPGWLVFLSIPVVSILVSTKHFNQKIPIIAIMPFIATTLFFIAGEFLNGYAWSWMFYFLIPMTAIIKGHK